MPATLDHWQVLPHGSLVEMDDGILTVAGDIPMPLGHFPRRMTVVRLSGNRTAIFSAIDALMLRPLPFPDADQLVRIYSIQKGMFNTFANPDGPSALDVRDFAQRSRSFQKIATYDTWPKNVSFGQSAGRPDQIAVGLFFRRRGTW